MVIVILLAALLLTAGFWYACWRKTLYFEGILSARDHDLLDGPTAPGLTLFLAPIFLAIFYVQTRGGLNPFARLNRSVTAQWQKGRDAYKNQVK